MNSEHPATPDVPRWNPVRELIVVLALQSAILLALFQLSERLSLQGILPAIVGFMFIFIPVFILDRTGKPYARYGLHFGRPRKDLLWSLGAMLLTFPPIVLAVTQFPFIWGTGNRFFELTIPDGFATIALSHLLVVALPEEFFYRGYVLGRLDDIFLKRTRILGVDAGPGLFIQAALFALGHFVVDLNPARLAVFFPALVFGWLRLKTGSIAPAVLYHACANIFMELFRRGYGF